MENYGKELILDLHDCDTSRFNRADLEIFFMELCESIDMKREDLHFWDYEGKPEEYEKAPPHLKGTSAIQFIQTSNITIHTLDDMKRIYLNIFSCKDFDSDLVAVFCVKFFGGRLVKAKEIDRI